MSGAMGRSQDGLGRGGHGDGAGAGPEGGAGDGAVERWPPQDDCLLIANTQQAADLIVVHQAVRFSQPYSLQALRERWYALLRHEPTSRLACAAMSRLSADQRAEIERKPLWSPSEENLLRTLPVAEDALEPTVEACEALLASEREIFLRQRRPADMVAHWRRLHRNGLLQRDQVTMYAGGPGTAVVPLERKARPDVQHMAFLELTETLGQPNSHAPSKHCRRALHVVDRKQKRKIRRLEAEIATMDRCPELQGLAHSPLDNTTLACLQTKLHTYPMRAQQMTVGRSAGVQEVDVDLAQEGDAMKVSRLQCVVRFGGDSGFTLFNKGKRPVYVNGRPVEARQKLRISHGSILQVAAVPMLFTTNRALVEQLLRDAAAGPSTAQPAAQPSPPAAPAVSTTVSAPAVTAPAPAPSAPCGGTE